MTIANSYHELLRRDYRPIKEAHRMLADSLLNAMIAFGGNITWTEGVNMLYARSVKWACRPYDAVVVNSVFKDMGLHHVNKPNSYSELKKLLTKDDVAFVKYGSNYHNGRVAVFYIRADNGRLIAISDDDPYSQMVGVVWIGPKSVVKQRIRELVQDIEDHTEAEMQMDTKPERKDAESPYYHYFQPNPLSKNIGDCVVRAFCGVLDEKWEAVMKQLADSLGNLCMDFNYDHNFLNLLLENGFGRCPLPRGRRGRLMLGVELCEWLKTHFPSGNCKAFAFVGRSHVAAVLPYIDENGNVGYRFHDSWNSTSGKITDLYVKVDESETTIEVSSKLTGIAIGIFIKHPQYGVGKVHRIVPYEDDAIVTIMFPGAEEKKIMKSWILKNCFSAK